MNQKTSNFSETVEKLRKAHNLKDSKPILAKHFQQAWRANPENTFEPGYVELHAEKEGFAVIAVLSDQDIHNSATGFNEPTWKTGDVFEIFIQTAADTYYEFHITPENHNLFLAWTTERFNAFRTGNADLDTAMIRNRNFISSATSIDHARNRWTVFARLPYSNLMNRRTTSALGLRVAFARYDANKNGVPPTLSASPDFPKLSFHMREFWDAVETPNALEQP